MVAWILRTGGRVPYVAGIFSSRAAAEAHLSTLPERIRGGCTLGSRDDLTFPCLLIEFRGDFRFVTADEAREALVDGAAGMQPDREGNFCDLYRVDGEYLPKIPGGDEMGRLPHWHLEATHLAAIARSGIATLWTATDEDAM